MSLRLCILGSGSGGNAALVMTGGACLLIDAGMSLNTLKSRMAARNWALDDVDALLVTHTHTDHLRSSSITACVNHRILMYNHPVNEEIIARRYRHFGRLVERRLNATFEGTLPALNDISVRTVVVPHDADGVTLALMIEHGEGRDLQRVAFATDLGAVPEALLDEFTDSDVLVLEFNHDVGMLRDSRRSAYLKERVNGAHGHLSNRQAAAALSAIIAGSRRPPLAVIPAHLSGECNSPAIVSGLVSEVLQEHNADRTRLFIASQDHPTEWIDIRSMRGQLSLF